MKIAIVHEMLIKLGGAEKVLEVLMNMYPQADVFTLMYDEKKVGSVFPKNRIWCQTFAQKLFSLTHKPRFSLPLMSASIEQIELSGYDVVISSSSGFAHGVRVPENAKHVCYCHSPARYLWDATDEVQRELGVGQEQQKSLIGNIKSHIGGPLVRTLFEHLRKWDLKASKNPKIYIANSAEVQGRIKQYYGIDAQVLWPPVEVGHFSPGNIPLSERTYYVVTSALTPFKKVDRVVRVMTKLGKSVKIIGDGAQRSSLQALAGPSVEFLGRISDQQKIEIYREARGFLMPQKEDAGIAPIEAMAAGIPVFGFGQGGLLEVQIEGVTGGFYNQDTDEDFEEKFLKFDQEIQQKKYDNTEEIIRHVARFDTSQFQEKMKQIIGV